MLKCKDTFGRSISAAIAVIKVTDFCVCSSTKEQAGNIVTDKIKNLMENYPNLRREIADIISNLNRWEVQFHNGSTIKVVASRDSARGKRATFLIYEEFRLIPKEILDSVIRPFAIVRQPLFLLRKEYKDIAILREEPKEVFISSSYMKQFWWYTETKKTIKAMLQGDNSGFYAVDLSVAVRHGIKTVRQIKNELSKVDDVVAATEYFNLPWGESSGAYFRLKLFQRARTIKKAFYPRKEDEPFTKKSNSNLPKTEGEIRILSCDLAQRGGSKNDLSISACIRLFPTTKGYERNLVYMESFSGINSITQALRIKRLFYDFEADYIVMDVASGGGGLPVVDNLGQISLDNERGIEYPAFTVMIHDAIDKTEYEELSKRTLGINALPIIFPVSGTAKLNSIIAVQMRNALQTRLWKFLVDESAAEDSLMRSAIYSKEFLDQESDGRARLLAPFIQTGFFINESISLTSMLNAGNLKLVEPSTGRKDRYTSVAYANLLCSYFDADLLKQYDDGSDIDLLLSLIQTSRSNQRGGIIGRY